MNRERRSRDFREYREKNKERLAENFARWAAENPGTVNAIRAKRFAAKLQATPSWADFDAIREVYKEAARISRATGIKHHVDHFYPLQGELVCGLHVAANLQILPAVENIRKHNRMPEELAA